MQSALTEAPSAHDPTQQLTQIDKVNELHAALVR